MCLHMQVIKHALVSLLSSMGYEIRRKRRNTASTATELSKAMERLHANGRLHVGSVIDVGASDGRWTAEVLPWWPAAQFLLVEA